MSKHILLIDDQESMRVIVSQVLTDRGYTVTAISDSEKGLELFKSDPAAIDLILADINMPKLDGFELLKYIRANYPTTRVVFFTGMDEDVTKTVGEEYKVDGIIRKPFVVEEAMQVIESVIAKNR